jgi:hypothetical protein
LTSPLWINGDDAGLNGSLIGKDGEGDIKQDSKFGGFIGFHKNIDSDMTVNFEWNATGSFNSFTFSIVRKF